MNAMLPWRGIPGAKVAFRETAGISIDDSQTVGAEQGDPVALGDLLEFAFALGPFLADLFEPRADDDRSAHALAPALFKNICDSYRGHDDHREIDLIGDVEHRRVGFHAQDAFGFGVDGVDDAGVAVKENIFEDGSAEAIGLGGRADDRDRFGGEERF
jgi:hypothetical protein